MEYRGYISGKTRRSGNWIITVDDELWFYPENTLLVKKSERVELSEGLRVIFTRGLFGKEKKPMAFGIKLEK